MPGVDNDMFIDVSRKKNRKVQGDTLKFLHSKKMFCMPGVDMFIDVSRKK